MLDCSFLALNIFLFYVFAINIKIRVFDLMTHIDNGISICAFYISRKI